MAYIVHPCLLGSRLLFHMEPTTAPLTTSLDPVPRLLVRCQEDNYLKMYQTKVCTLTAFVYLQFSLCIETFARQCSLPLTTCTTVQYLTFHCGTALYSFITSAACTASYAPSSDPPGTPWHPGLLLSSTPPCSLCMPCSTQPPLRPQLSSHKLGCCSPQTHRHLRQEHFTQLQKVSQ